MFLDDSACNLASINLMKFRPSDGTFDAERFQAACRLVFIAQEILVDHASYPDAADRRQQPSFPPAGAGLLEPGQPDHGQRLALRLGRGPRAVRGGDRAAARRGLPHQRELAAAVGPFDGYEENREPMLQVMEMHWERVEQIKACPKYLQDAARKLWDEVLVRGRRHGFRNAQATVLAPTGTISFMMDCDTTGIEPDIALVKYKQLAGGGMLKIVNQTVPLALRTLGYAAAEIESIMAHIDKQGHDRGGRRIEARALAGVRLRLPAAQRHAVRFPGRRTSG